MALKAMDKSNNEVRFEVAKVFGKIGSYAVNNKEQKPVASKYISIMNLKLYVKRNKHTILQAINKTK